MTLADVALDCEREKVKAKESMVSDLPLHSYETIATEDANAASERAMPHLPRYCPRIEWILCYCSTSWSKVKQAQSPALLRGATAVTKHASLHLQQVPSYSCSVAYDTAPYCRRTSSNVLAQMSSYTAKECLLEPSVVSLNPPLRPITKRDGCPTRRRIYSTT